MESCSTKHVHDELCSLKKPMCPKIYVRFLFYYYTKVCGSLLENVNPYYLMYVPSTSAYTVPLVSETPCME